MVYAILELVEVPKFYFSFATVHVAFQAFWLSESF